MGTKRLGKGRVNCLHPAPVKLKRLNSYKVPFPPIFCYFLFNKMVTLFYKMVTLFYNMLTLFYNMLTLFYNMLTLFYNMLTLFYNMLTLFLKW